MAAKRADFNFAGYGRMFLLIAIALFVLTVWPASLCTMRGIDEDINLDEIARTQQIQDVDSLQREGDVTRVSGAGGFFGGIRNSAMVCFGAVECEDTHHRSCAEAAPISAQEPWKRFGAAGAFGMWILFGFFTRMQLRRDARRLGER